MSVAMNKFHYKLPYKTYFGGVSAMSVKHFKLVNGFSNQFWGWGGEDDDMFNRVHDHGLPIARLNEEGYYKMARHEPEVKNPKRGKLLQTGVKR